MAPHPSGARAEQRALLHLQNAGLTLITRNYHTRFGEIDLIMMHSKTIVFVEVRRRTSARFGTAIESIGPMKVRRLRNSAQWFLKDRRYAVCVKTTQSRRFDIVALDGVEHSATLTWTRDAF